MAATDAEESGDEEEEDDDDEDAGVPEDDEATVSPGDMINQLIHYSAFSAAKVM